MGAWRSGPSSTSRNGRSSGRCRAPCCLHPHPTLRASRSCPTCRTGPGMPETYETIDYLREAGIEYVADWVLDDQPCLIDTASGPMVSVPYTVEMNDIAMMVLQNHPSEEWLRRGIDCFDRLYAEGEKSARVMAISVHPYITGVPHRIGYLERLYGYIGARPGVLMWTGEQILDWYKIAAGVR